MGPVVRKKAVVPDADFAESGKHPVSRRFSDRATPSYDLSEYARAVLSDAEIEVGEPFEIDRRSVPQVVVSKERIAGLHLDHRQGFLLSLVDGHSTVETLLDVCAMPEELALLSLFELVHRKVIVLR